jgi:hypothetical protein
MSRFGPCFKSYLNVFSILYGPLSRLRSQDPVGGMWEWTGMNTGATIVKADTSETFWVVCPISFLPCVPIMRVLITSVSFRVARK